MTDKTATTEKLDVAVLGCGSWGTALAILLANNQHNVGIWGKNTAHLEQMESQRCNSKYLPGVTFPPTLNVIHSLEKCVSLANRLLIVIPTAGVLPILKDISNYAFNSETKIIFASKGFEPQNSQLFHSVVSEIFTSNFSYCVISGPTFAKEVAKGLPTAITVASENIAFSQEVSSFLTNQNFRAYTSSDVIGVEVGGAVKNVMAIAAGISDGMGFGSNTRAALITRGLHEITQLGNKLGGRPETFMGLAGIGDLVLTCTDDQSRNRRIGLGLAAGKTIQQIQSEIGQCAEGVGTTKRVFQLAKKLDVDMPIVEQVYNVIYHNKSPKQAVVDLMNRAIRAEN